MQMKEESYDAKPLKCRTQLRIEKKEHKYQGNFLQNLLKTEEKYKDDIILIVSFH